jgi:hypothetical protein
MALTGFDELALSEQAAEFFLHGHAERIFGFNRAA